MVLLYGYSITFSAQVPILRVHLQEYVHSNEEKTRIIHILMFVRMRFCDLLFDNFLECNIRLTVWSEYIEFISIKKEEFLDNCAIWTMNNGTDLIKWMLSIWKGRNWVFLFVKWPNVQLYKIDVQQIHLLLTIIQFFHPSRNELFLFSIKCRKQGASYFGL